MLYVKNKINFFRYNQRLLRLSDSSSLPPERKFIFKKFNISFYNIYKFQKFSQPFFEWENGFQGVMRTESGEAGRTKTKFSFLSTPNYCFVFCLKWCVNSSILVCLLINVYIFCDFHTKFGVGVSVFFVTYHLT